MNHERHILRGEYITRDDDGNITHRHHFFIRIQDNDDHAALMAFAEQLRSGRQLIWKDGKAHGVCGECDGYGRVHWPHADAVEQDCPRCNGTGFADAETEGA
jgi:hypothetical protein